MSNAPVSAPPGRHGIPWSLAGLLAGFLVIVVALAVDTALLLRSVDTNLSVTPAAASVTVAVAPFTL